MHSAGIVGKCVGVRGRKGRCGKRYERRCRKVCWGVGEVRGDVGKGEGSEEMWGRVGGSVLGPHTLLYTSSIPLPTRQHIFPFTPFTLPHPSSHFSTPHTSFLTSPTPQHTSLHLPPYLFSQLPSPPPTYQHTSPFTPCTLPHLSPHLPSQFRLCGEGYHVTMLPL